MLDNFCSYLRVSTDKQGITGLGMEAQREAVRRYVQTRGRIIAEFIEVESGKKHTNRPQLLAAIAECRKRRGVLLIAQLDRLARNVVFIANLMNSDVEFVAVDMPHANRLTIHILAAVAEHEREMISPRTKAALAAAKARGVKMGNPRYQEALAKARAALGCKPPPAEVLQLMTDWRGQGDVLRKIAARLNGLNIRTSQGCIWYAASVRAALLRNRPELYASLLPAAGITATPMPTDLMQAQRMVDLFTSVGVQKFVIASKDINDRLIWPPSYLKSIGKRYARAEDAHFTPLMLQRALGHMLPLTEIRRRHQLPDGRMVEAGENLMIRPVGG
jgi:hypothetical protein